MNKTIINIKYNSIITSIKNKKDNNSLFTDIINDIEDLLLKGHFNLIDDLTSQHELDLSITNEKGTTILMAICLTEKEYEKQNIKTAIEYLITKDIELEKTDDYGNTALFYCYFNTYTLDVLFEKNINYKHINSMNENYADYITCNFINLRNKTLSNAGKKMLNHFNILIEHKKLNKTKNTKTTKTRFLL